LNEPDFSLQSTILQKFTFAALQTRINMQLSVHHQSMQLNNQQKHIQNTFYVLNESE